MASAAFDGRTPAPPMQAIGPGPAPPCDTPAATLIDEYRRLRGRAADIKLFALIDSSGYAEVARGIAAGRTMPAAWQSLFGLAAGDDKLPATPLLVDVSALETDRSTARLVEQLCRDAAEANAVCFLAGRLPLAALGARLRARLDAELPGGMAVTLRYFDTRVLPVLAAVLDAPQRARFLSCAQAWWYLDRRGGLAALEPAPFSEQDEFASPLVLSEQQERQLILASEPDALIDLLLRQAPDLIGPLPLAERYAFVSDQIRRAREFRLSELADLALYAMLALELGPDFHRTDPWRDDLAVLAEGKLTMQQLLQEAGDDAA